MSACERCWADSRRMSIDYNDLVGLRNCTPEEQAGPDAKECPACKRMTLHQYTGEPMCGCVTPPAPRTEGKTERIITFRNEGGRIFIRACEANGDLIVDRPAYGFEYELHLASQKAREECINAVRDMLDARHQDLVRERTEHPERFEIDGCVQGEPDDPSVFSELSMAVLALPLPAVGQAGEKEE